MMIFFNILKYSYRRGLTRTDEDFSYYSRK
jgi:hypothetical protein